ncbi:phage holin family protein [Candidatus Aquiluna sp. UB-MaderosW2red]|jgi:putative membrane protein|uniref:phage holin family protein n=1 Tax=Candidatus Aquiluna sp. UB-MaderosW2red TaxID=1855377 RepID=UPI000875E8A8|nr:phage holin family protein [Candidatus Aquiluna sp. UB-MaderosW2red]SCX04327.1 putative membrane protein [Candidatus Aquiluna sp. UB-MaderosW2red]
MLRFLVSTIVNALGLWAATQLVPAITLTPYGGDGLWNTIASFLAIGAIFGLVNAIIAPVIKVLAFPLYIITFGLIAFVINGALLLFVAWLSTLFAQEIFTIEGFTSEGLEIASLGWAILAAIVMSIASFIARALLKLVNIR